MILSPHVHGIGGAPSAFDVDEELARQAPRHNRASR
jgi:hypothetical protein